ncbi:lig_chan-Glu_bd domain-containing protein [Caerostris extrusa]|uniref:Lig_chan-Glu_bd domain-containing protein n=1 Tax=Caerostris extrusa TaxID=172846 RepID=A0AAV4WNX4_CAEEX|nr:lig_chan-Glu_bd domain-containing protein [Caerostris extrusa]
MKWNSSVTTKLNVAYAKLAPFVDVQETDKGDILGGFIPQIMQMVANWMNLELTYIREPFDTYGNLVNGSWNGMVGMLFRNEVDLILNPILPKPEFLEFLYYTNPITIEAYTILSGKKSEELGLFLYFSVLDKSVWMGIIIALIVIAVTSAALFRRAAFPSSFKWLHFIGQYSWNLLSYMMKQVPKKNFLLRNHKHVLSIFLPLLNMLWVFCVAFLIMNTFQSLLVSKLALKKVVPIVDTVADLARSHGVICIAPREIQIDHVLKYSDLEINRKAWTKIDNEMSTTEHSIKKFYELWKKENIALSTAI